MIWVRSRPWVATTHAVVRLKTGGAVPHVCPRHEGLARGEELDALRLCRGSGPPIARVTSELRGWEAMKSVTPANTRAVERAEPLAGPLSHADLPMGFLPGNWSNSCSEAGFCHTRVCDRMAPTFTEGANHDQKADSHDGRTGHAGHPAFRRRRRRVSSLPAADGRAGRGRLQVHRRPRLRRRGQRLLHRSAQRPDPEVERRRQALHLHAALRTLQRPVLRRATGNLWACADEKNELWCDRSRREDHRRGEGVRGQALNGPNDIWVDPDGGIYFTDPFYKRP